MKYIETNPGYLLDEVDDIIKLNIDDFLETREVPEFSIDDLALLRGREFNPLGETINDTEDNNKKEYIQNINFIIVADTDINALTYIFENEMHYTVDFSPIVRFEELSEMKELLEFYDPKFLSDKKIKNKKNYKKEDSFVFLFSKIDTREKFYEHVIVSKNDDVNKYIDDYKSRDWINLMVMSEDEILNTYAQFKKIVETQDIYYRFFIPNKRNDIPEDLGRLEKRSLLNIFSPIVNAVDDLEKLKSKDILDKDYLIENITFNAISLEKKREKIISDLNLNEFDDEDNIVMIDFLTLNRLDLNKLKGLEDVILKRKEGLEMFVKNVQLIIDEYKLLKEKILKS